MTQASSKPSLLGRKRTKDLQDALHPGEKIDLSQAQRALLDLQENLDLLPSSSSEGVQPVSVKQVKPIVADKVTRASFEQEAFEYLLAFHQNLKNPNQAIRVSYSLSEQNRRLLEAIKHIINYYGQSLKSSNLPERSVTEKCQELLDSLVSRLVREGVKLRRLSLTPDKS